MAFAVTGASFNVRTIPESWIFLQDVYTLPFGEHFLKNDKIPQAITPGHPAVLIKNDCVLIAGKQLLQTFDFLEVAEFSAKSLVMAAPIGQLVPINNEQVEELRKKFLA